MEPKLQSEESKELVHLIKKMLQNADTTKVVVDEGILADSFVLDSRKFSVGFNHIGIDGYTLDTNEFQQVKVDAQNLIKSAKAYKLSQKRKFLLNNLKGTK